MKNSLESLKSKNTLQCIDYICSLLPVHLMIPTKDYLMTYTDISEIRLRINQNLSFTKGNINLITGITVSSEDLNYTFLQMTENNFGLHEETICDGYICLKHGCRGGICGDAFVKDGKIQLVRKINSINLRLPTELIVDCSNILNLLENENFKTGILIISNPGGGKTTLLRSLVYYLSSPPVSKRIVCIDTNNELYLPSFKNDYLCDFLCGYPKSKGISIAVKYFNPQIIVCDEIGSDEEAELISSNAHSGVPLICSAHLSSFSDLSRKSSIYNMINTGIFSYIVLLNEMTRTYEIKKANEL